jgi:hypothetical protein
MGTITSGLLRCGSSNYYAGAWQVPYHVLDSNKSSMQIPTMVVTEQLSWNSAVCATSDGCGQQPAANTWSTDSSGGFVDTIANCSTLCVAGKSCTEAWQQTFQVWYLPVGIVNGSSTGSENCVTTNCSAYPALTTH